MSTTREERAGRPRSQRVWAPNSERVDLQLGSTRIAMQPAEHGWWTVDVPAAQADADYAFSLDGAPPRPDPRSSWQPAGIHGASRRVDHAAFHWSDADWNPPALSGGVVYELHVGTFTREGTFSAVIDRLDHLVDLGITHVELMPVQEFSGVRGWGYDGVDLYAPHHAYGGPHGLKTLVDACHARGLAVVLDVVYNHLGPAGNYLGEFGPYFTDRYKTPWGAAVNLDGRGSDEVRRFLCDNALMWLRDYHMDGLRIDAVHALFDQSAVHFLEQLALEAEALQRELGRQLVLIAESDLNDPRLCRRRALGGYGLQAQWNDDFHHALHALLSGERRGYYADFGSIADVATALRDGFVYGGRYSQFRGRSHGRTVGDLDGNAFIGFLQNHDQIGNRARGERSAQLMSRGRLAIGAALVFTAPFVPMLFQGEEWGASTPFLYFTAHEDPGLGRRVREGRRREFAGFDRRREEVPDPQAEATFERCKLDWSEVDRAPHAELLEWHRSLIRLRRGTPALTDGRRDLIDVHFDERARWLVVARGPIAVACNLAEHTQQIPVGAETRRIKLASQAGVSHTVGSVELPADSVAIL
jgi:maltooligosyltrehalose trehalohydrolase